MAISFVIPYLPAPRSAAKTPESRYLGSKCSNRKSQIETLSSVFRLPRRSLLVRRPVLRSEPVRRPVLRSDSEGGSFSEGG